MDSAEDKNNRKTQSANKSKALVDVTPKKGNKNNEFFVDWDLVDKLCQLHCTLVEVAATIGCHPETLINKCKKEKGMRFRDYFAMKSAGARVHLRRMIFTEATKGDKFWMDKLATNWLKFGNTPRDGGEQAGPEEDAVQFEQALEKENDTQGVKITIQTKDGERFTPGQFIDPVPAEQPFEAEEEP